MSRSTHDNGRGGRRKATLTGFNVNGEDRAVKRFVAFLFDGEFGEMEVLLAGPEGAGLPLRVPLTTATKGLPPSWQEEEEEAEAAGRPLRGTAGRLRLWRGAAVRQGTLKGAILGGETGTDESASVS